MIVAKNREFIIPSITGYSKLKFFEKILNSESKKICSYNSYKNHIKLQLKQLNIQIISKTKKKQQLS